VECILNVLAVFLLRIGISLHELQGILTTSVFALLPKALNPFLFFTDHPDKDEGVLIYMAQERDLSGMAQGIQDVHSVLAIRFHRFATFYSLVRLFSTLCADFQDHTACHCGMIGDSSFGCFRPHCIPKVLQFLHLVEG
jgi:hypothetical protein